MDGRNFYLYQMSVKGFIVKSADGIIRFRYDQEAPVTSAAFDERLPFSKELIHARVAGQEIWTDDAPLLDIIQENASVFAEPGEVVIGPLKPSRVKTSGCLGIYYGVGKGLDSCNIFAKAYEEDMPKLKALGEQIWKAGIQKISFERLT